MSQVIAVPGVAGLSFELTIGLARKIKQRFQIDFANPMLRTSGLEKLNDNDVLSDVMWVLVESHAHDLGMDDETFFSLLTGDVLGTCYDLLMEELTLFIRPDLRPAFQAMLQAAKEHDQAKVARAAETFQSPTTKEIFQQSLVKTQEEIEANLKTQMLGAPSTSAKRY